jgi:hypothetical protein
LRYLGIRPFLHVWVAITVISGSIVATCAAATFAPRRTVGVIMTWAAAAGAVKPPPTATVVQAGIAGREVQGTAYAAARVLTIPGTLARAGAAV